MLWKFLHTVRTRNRIFDEEVIRSRIGDQRWVIGQWESVEPPVELCSNGFHASRSILDALSYAPGNVVALVEVDGEGYYEKDKSVHERMRIVRAWHWDTADSVALATYAANLVLSLFEESHPEGSQSGHETAYIPRTYVNAANATGYPDVAATFAYAACKFAMSTCTDVDIHSRICDWMLSRIESKPEINAA